MRDYHQWETEEIIGVYRVTLGDYRRLRDLGDHGILYRSVHRVTLGD